MDYNFQEIEWLDSQLQINFSVVNSQNNEIHYIQDGGILKTQVIFITILLKIELGGKAEIIMNLQQIKYLKWEGQIGNNNQKVGKWIPYWKMQGLFSGGIYDDQGMKQGIWRDLDENFSDQAQITQSGQYLNSIKVGRWDIIHNNQIIGGGDYDDYGQKNGKWIELYRNFAINSSSFCSGKYQKGKRIGHWIILTMNQEIGGGLYNDIGLKNGLWIDFSIKNFSQFIYKGNYQNGIKQGQWNTYFRAPTYSSEKKFEYIGGGQYDNNGFKDGMWIDINESFNTLNHFTYHGEYKNNKKYGRWDIIYSKYGRQQQFNQIPSNNRGGGFFNKNGMKDGIWVEFADWYMSLVMFRGEYKNSLKFGRWDILFKYENFDHYQLIGGGTYDIIGLKQGQWIDMNEDSYTLQGLITYNGEYIDNIKQGFWKIMFWSYTRFQNFEQRGGGQFNLCGMKEGKWIELHPQFAYYTQIIHSGDYINGQKCGRWDTCILDITSNKFEKIGGGWYDVDGLKYGIWMDLIDKATIFSSITYKGEYVNGKKSGNWIIMQRDQDFNYYQIGGGLFDQNGFKHSLWTELDGDYYNMGGKFETYKGEYKKGQKCGTWEIYSKYKIIQNTIKYNQNGIIIVKK